MPLNQTQEDLIATQLIQAHGTIMILAWGILIKISILTAAFYQNDKYLKVNGLWFTIHMYTNYLVALLTMCGALLAFSANSWQFLGILPNKINPEIDTYSINVKNHSNLGLTVLIFSFTNVFLGIIRPPKINPESQMTLDNCDQVPELEGQKIEVEIVKTQPQLPIILRKTWFAIHRTIGCLTLILADITIFYGLYIWNYDMWESGDTIYAVLTGFNIVTSLIYVYFKNFTQKQPVSWVWVAHVVIILGLGIGSIITIYV